MEEQVKTIEQGTQQQVADSACGCGSGGCGCGSGHHHHGHHHHQHELPVRFQILRPGDRVVELGCGTGNDALVAAQLIGDKGKVTGIDISEKNIDTARTYSDQLRIHNVEFRQGDIRDIPLPKEYADIVLANCVFNHQQDKQKVADEMYRICHHNGMVCVSDFVIIHDIPEGLRKDAAQLAGSIGGAEHLNTFMDYFRKTGFEHVEIIEMQKVHLPDDLFNRHLSPEEVEAYKSVESDHGIFNVTLAGEKPSTCSPDTCCCNPDKHNN